MLQIGKRRINQAWILAQIVFLCWVKSTIDMSLLKIEGIESPIQNLNYKINPSGPLNIIIGKLYREIGYMQNLYNFSPWIYKNHKLEYSKNGVFTVRQSFDIESVFLSNEGDLTMTRESNEYKKNAYMLEHAKQVVRMFLYAYENTPIIPQRCASYSDLFILFLFHRHIKQHRFYILSALLLLSEGIDVPIEISIVQNHRRQFVEKLMLRKYTRYDEMVYYIYTSLWLEKNNRLDEKIYYNGAKEVIQFFIKNRNNPLLSDRNEFAELGDYRTFKTGKFLNGTKFLIQSYISEFISSAEEYREFIEVTYELINNQTKNTQMTQEEYEIVNSVFKRLFIIKNVQAENSVSYINPIYDVTNYIRKNDLLPHINSVNLTEYCECSGVYTLNNLKVKDSSVLQRNQMNMAILNLVLFLLYNTNNRDYLTGCDDPKSRSYNSDLINFFKKHGPSLNVKDPQMRKEWERILYTKTSSNISYYENGNISSGLMNILHVLIVIMQPDIVQRNKLAGNLNLNIKKAYKASENLEIRYENIKSVIIDLLFKLTNMSNVFITELSLQRLIFRAPCNKFELIGTINLLFKFNKATCDVTLNITTDTFTVSSSLDKYCKDEIEKTIKSSQNYSINLKTHTGNLVYEYICGLENKYFKMNYKYDDNYLLRVGLNIQKGTFNLYELLVDEKFSSSIYRGQFVFSFLLNTTPETLSNSHELVRFTSNIIKYNFIVRGDKKSMRLILNGLLVNKNYVQYYGSFIIGPIEFLRPESEITYFLIKSLISNILLMGSIRHLCASLSSMLELSLCVEHVYNNLETPYTANCILNLITRAHIESQSSYIQAFLNSIDSKISRYNSSYIALIFLYYSCISSTCPKSITIGLYNSINSTHLINVTKTGIQSIFNAPAIGMIASRLKSLKDEISPKMKMALFSNNHVIKRNIKYQMIMHIVQPNATM
ncbi:hypothetical protein NEIRO03_1758 [Nematocida sp. AWRm78]|nr:hypothetical protein NEIRO03_1758 [Nematocida sp. AWRm78]